MNDLLADTHAVVWHLFEPSRLSTAAATALAQAVASGGVIYISAITLVEIRYLIEKGKLPATHWNGLWQAVHDPATPMRVLTVSSHVAAQLAAVPRSVVPDMPDRIIAATALATGLPLLTCDPKIQATNVPTIW